VGKVWGMESSMFPPGSPKLNVRKTRIRNLTAEILRLESMFEIFSV